MNSVPLDFTAIDFETANASSASACAVGMCCVRDGEIVERASWLIRPTAPNDSFAALNIDIHGITPKDVEGAETWAEQLPRMLDFVGDDVLAAHYATFDAGVIRATSAACGAPFAPLRFACSLRMSRRIHNLASHKLPLVAKHIGFREFRHHDALDDADACAAIVIDAGRRSEARSIEHLAKTLGTPLQVVEYAPDAAAARFSKRR